jgi:hypothetical protein
MLLILRGGEIKGNPLAQRFRTNEMLLKTQALAMQTKSRITNHESRPGMTLDKDFVIQVQRVVGIAGGKELNSHSLASDRRCY